MHCRDIYDQSEHLLIKQQHLCCSLCCATFTVQLKSAEVNDQKTHSLSFWASAVFNTNASIVFAFVGYVILALDIILNCTAWSRGHEQVKNNPINILRART